MDFARFLSLGCFVGDLGFILGGFAVVVCVRDISRFVRVGGFCPGGSCPGGFCPRIMSNTSKHMLRYNCAELVSAKRIIRFKLLSCKPSPFIEVKCTKKIIRPYNIYLSLRSNKNGPLFINENGSSITRPQFVKVLKSQLTHLNYNATLYNTHSFWIGRASNMAAEGYSENQIAMVRR